MVHGKFCGSFHLVAPERDEVDLAAVDAAFFVDLLEVGGLDLADRPVGGGRPAVRHGVTDLDLGIGGAGVVLLLGRGRSGR
jgi:hypothetical protein